MRHRNSQHPTLAGANKTFQMMTFATSSADAGATPRTIGARQRHSR